MFGFAKTLLVLGFLTIELVSHDSELLRDRLPRRILYLPTGLPSLAFEEQVGRGQALFDCCLGAGKIGSRTAERSFRIS